VVSGVFSIPLDVDRTESQPLAGDELRPAFPLREFISGSENALARVADEALLRDDPQLNPLVVYGDSGTGKSHLCLGLVARWKHEHPRAKTLVTPASDFARAYSSAIDADALEDFRRMYRRLDLALLENLQELAGKDAAQHELLVLLDDWLRRSRRVLVTSAKLPAETVGLAPALVSRLMSGLLVPLTRPTVEPRKVILRQLAAAHRLHLDDDALALLAEQLDTAVPALHSAVLTLKQRANGKQAVDLEDATAFLANGEANPELTLRSITTRVARYYKLRSADLKGPTRRRAVVQARGVAMYLARQLTDKSLDEVGRHFGGRDHTTVLHACRKTGSLLAADAATRKAIDELTAQLT
jgi:chromosomal replication initiator protein